MSAVKKLCSLIHKSSRSIITLNKRDFYTTNFQKLNRSVVVMSNGQNLQLMTHAQQKKNYSQALGSLTKDQAHDLVFRLNEEERTILFQTLEQYQMKEDKQKLECKCTIHYSFNLMNMNDRIHSGICHGELSLTLFVCMI